MSSPGAMQLQFTTLQNSDRYTSLSETDLPREHSPKHRDCLYASVGQRRFEPGPLRTLHRFCLAGILLFQVSFGGCEGFPPSVVIQFIEYLLSHAALRSGVDRQPSTRSIASYINYPALGTKWIKHLGKDGPGRHLDWGARPGGCIGVGCTVISRDNITGV